jgi:two-component system sensor kinase FixL
MFIGLLPGGSPARRDGGRADDRDLAAVGRPAKFGLLPKGSYGSPAAAPAREIIPCEAGLGLKCSRHTGVMVRTGLSEMAGGGQVGPEPDGNGAKAGALAESSLRAVLDTAVDGIIIIDSAALVRLYNPACERIFGYPAAEVIGRNVKMLMPSPYHEEHDEYVRHYRETGERRIIGIGREVVGRRKDGATFPMELSVGEARQGAERVFVGIIRDISERHRLRRRMLEMQAELVHVSRLSAMGEMASTLAHELNQPLTAVMNYVQAAQRMVEAPPGRFPAPRIAETMGKAIEQAERAGQIIRRLREFIRKGETDRSPADINQVVREAGGLGLIGAREQGIDVRYALSPGLPAVLIDRIQIQQVILNLVRNSVEAMHEAPRREIEFRTGLAAAGLIEVVISDTGPGLPAEVTERLFQPFVTTKPNGTGIGLSISRSIVEAHGGHLAPQPREAGAAFRFTLPTAEPGAQP